jgi:beta-glucosidase
MMKQTRPPNGRMGRQMTTDLRRRPLPLAALLTGLTAAGMLALSGAAAAQDSTAHPEIWPEIAVPHPGSRDVEARVEEILAGMTLEQKIGQVIQGDIASVTPEDVRRYHLGSVLNGGNSAPGEDLRAAPEDWLALADAFWEASMTEDGPGIPVIWGTDAVHGHSNVVGATVFPHNIGLGATNDPDLLERIGAATALEIRITGIDWTFAPTVAVARDDRWGRTYESYSEDAELVSRLGAAMVRGLQGDPGSDDFLQGAHTLATAKHFLADGGTTGGRDQGDARLSEEDLRDLHGAGYAGPLEAGLQSVMASFSSWNGVKMHGHEGLLTGVLKDHWGFDGFIVGDWDGHGQIPGCTPGDCVESILAGLDMYMAPESWRELHGTLLAHAEAGTLPMERLDDAVRRILRVKIRAGMDGAPRPSERVHAGDFDVLGGEAHTELAREAVRASAVLLKNENDVLPLNGGANILVAGGGADDLSILSGGWTISWQGDGVTHDDFPRAETLLAGIERMAAEGGGSVIHAPDGAYDAVPDVAVVVFGERPYAEYRGDLDNVAYSPSDRSDVELLRGFQEAGIPTVAVFVSGRPLWVNPELNASDAFVAAFLPGTQAGALADTLFGAEGMDFTGRLSFSWPKRPDQAPLNHGDTDYDPLFALGYGLTLGERSDLGELSEEGLPGTPDALALFDDGELQGGWRLTAEDAAGRGEFHGAPVASPEGVVQIARGDLGRQENALTLDWNDAGQASFWRGPSDMTRAAEAGFVLRLRYAVDTPAGAAPLLGVVCGEDCEAGFALDGLTEETAAPSGDVIEIPLSCLAEAGVDLAAVETVSIATQGAMALRLSQFTVASAEGEAAPCPSAR